MAGGRPGFGEDAQAGYDAHAMFDVAVRAPRARPELFRTTTVEEFEAFLATVDESERFEWVRGRIAQQQADQTRRHARLEQRIEQLLLAQLDPAAWQVLREYAVWTGDAYRITDVVVDPAEADDQERRSEHPALIVEVLSATSGKRDRQDKPADYLTLSSLQAYIIVDQFSRTCEAYVRDGVGQFPSQPIFFSDAGPDEMSVASLGITLSIAAIYYDLVDRDPSTGADC